MHVPDFLSKKLVLGLEVQLVGVRPTEVVSRSVVAKQGSEAQDITFVAMVFVGELVGDGPSRGFDESHVSALDHSSVGWVVDAVSLAIQSESTEFALESPVFQFFLVPLVMYKCAGSDNAKS